LLVYTKIQKFKFDWKFKEQSKKLDQEIIEAYQLQHDFKEFQFLEHIHPTAELSSHPPPITSIVQNPSNDDDEEETVIGANITQLPTRAHSLSFNEDLFRMESPLRGRVLQRLTKALDGIVNEPFAYFMGRADPISLHLAMRYIITNEASDLIYVIHFVDDRALYHKPLHIEEQEEEKAGDHEEETKEVLEDTEGCIVQGQLLIQRLLLRDMGIIDDETLHQTVSKDEVDERKDCDEDEDASRNYYAHLPAECKHIMDYVAILDTYYT
jgi:hypothetical protein